MGPRIKIVRSLAKTLRSGENVFSGKRNSILCSNQSCTFFSDLQPFKGRKNYRKGY